MNQVLVSWFRTGGTGPIEIFRAYILLSCPLPLKSMHIKLSILNRVISLLETFFTLFFFSLIDAHTSEGEGG